jgi:acyl carrier protein
MMKDVDRRLLVCFSAVFPTLSEEQIRVAIQDSTAEWDSLASLMLAGTIEEEFGIQADLSLMDRLSSFADVRAFVVERTSPSH